MSTITNTYGDQQWADVSSFGNSDTAASPGPTSLASKDVFLQLLVTQLKNQNPLDPADGTEFVSQLAQFTQLEQSMSMSQDLSAIRGALVSDTSASGQDTTQP